MTRLQVLCLKLKNVLRYRIQRLSAALISPQTFECPVVKFLGISSGNAD
jgi:hypothetical protein